jgi:hypothetical protein
VKVRQLQDVLLDHQDVGRFYVSVDDLVVMDEEEALAHLLHDLLDLTKTELHIDVAQDVLAEVILESSSNQIHILKILEISY